MQHSREHKRAHTEAEAGYNTGSKGEPRLQRVAGKNTSGTRREATLQQQQSITAQEAQENPCSSNSRWWWRTLRCRSSRCNAAGNRRWKQKQAPRDGDEDRMGQKPLSTVIFKLFRGSLKRPVSDPQTTKTKAARQPWIFRVSCWLEGVSG